jgi:hypothetical protein
MVWEDSELMGGRSRMRNRTLRANARVSAGKPAAARVAILAFAIAVLAAGVAVVWLGISFAGRKLFSSNSLFTVRKVEIVGEGDIVSYFMNEKKQIREGTSNLFSFDLAALRDEFMKQRFAAKYKSMELTRILPDTLRVQVVERVPVARLTGSGALVADAEGFVFGLGTGRQALPVLMGYPASPPLPGERLQGNACAAVALLDLCEQTGLSRDLLIGSIDVTGGFRGRPDDLRVYLLDKVEADIWWPHGDTFTAASMQNLRERLAFLGRVLAWCRENGKRARTVNLTLESFTNNCPVTYWD